MKDRLNELATELTLEELNDFLREHNIDLTKEGEVEQRLPSKIWGYVNNGEGTIS